MQSTYPHLDIDAWLTVLDLRQYAGKLAGLCGRAVHDNSPFRVRLTTESFRQFVGVEELLHFSETDVKHLGIIKSAHRARIVSSLVALREKAIRLRGSSSTNGGFV